MRAWLTTLVAGLVIGIVGCAPLAGYLNRPVHFSSATVGERQLSKSADRTVSYIELVLQDRNISIRKIEKGAESSRVWATKDGIDYVFDISAIGTGCQVRLEMGQVGNEATVNDLLANIEMCP